MSEEQVKKQEKNQQKEEMVQKDTNEREDTISALFDERDRPQVEEKTSKKEAEPSPPEKIKSEHSGKPSAQKESSQSPSEEEDDDKKVSEVDSLRKKLEKTEKTLLENQKYGRQNAQKIKNLQKAVKEMAVDGVLTDAESEQLLEILQLEAREEDEENKKLGSSHPFAPIFKIANQELVNIRKYMDDPLLQDKIDAFDYFLSGSSPEEIQEALEGLTGLMNDPVKLTKAMLRMGQKSYEESYKDIKEAGGIKNYLAQKNQDMEKLQKKVDKLEKKLSQYKDFDQPRYRIDEMGDGDENLPVKDTITTLFEERDRIKRRVGSLA